MTDPATTLRAAADRLRTLAIAASPGPTDTGGWAISMPAPHNPDELLTVLHPGVCRAMADWLTHAARSHAAAVTAAANVWGSEHRTEAREFLESGPGSEPHALALARQILGEDTNR